MKKLILTLFLIPFISITCWGNSLMISKETVNDFENGRFDRETKRALGTLIESGMGQLIKAGFGTKSIILGYKWERASLGLYDVGDHAPWKEFLTEFYGQLEKVLGKEKCQKEHYDDLLTMNYVIPVVFHPKGINGVAWGEEEYQKHFIPFMQIVCYWGSYGACNAAPISFAKSVVCKPVAEGVKWWAGKYWAPNMSNRIYRKYNKI